MSAATARSASSTFSCATFSCAATIFTTPRKHEAQPAQSSCSGLVAPPMPPSSFGIARVTSSEPSAAVARPPLQPSPVAVTTAV
ncbi:hypothetical protein AB0F91_07940 [Amycolatopsis sp. NPDC023774]|uniref:hypothetical protein n=1 Tax=Amycolatopsis sp. NPDC023774 TaxID=3155015 RepID=UPI0033C6558B